MAWRIAHVDSERGYSGGEVQVFLLLEGLRQRGHEVLLFCQPDSRCSQEAERRGIPHQTIPMANDADWRGFTHLTRALRQQPIDLVHLHTGRANWLGGLAAWRSGVPAVTTRRMDRRVRAGWRSRAIYGRFVKRVISISPAVTERLRGGGVWMEKIELIPEAVDPSRLKPVKSRGEVRDELGARDIDSVVFVMSALVPRKGIDVLLDALALDPLAAQPVKVWIAGEGSQRRLLEAQVQRLGLRERVRFLGPRDDAADLLRACDIFAMPSRSEGLGVAALEAMAMARPVVCSDVGGLAFSVVHERTGLRVPVGEPQPLAEAIAQLIRDPALRTHLGDAGPERIEEDFSPDKMVDAHIRLYERVLSFQR